MKTLTGSEQIPLKPLVCIRIEEPWALLAAPL